MSPKIHYESTDDEWGAQVNHLVCRKCGHEHRSPLLCRGETARCMRCDSVLAKKGWFGRDATFAFAVTGLLLVLPSFLLPFITVRKLGSIQVSFLFTGVRTLWADGMHGLAVWVLLCGGLAPMLLLMTLVGLFVSDWRGWKSVHAQRLAQAVRVVAYWSIPEVQVLAVLIALAKMGHVVQVVLGPGFWCYAALAMMTMLAWRGFDLDCLP
ncbi:MAG TPA: paraquat-inducible protein A [Opitutales bacterium]|jgi:paraquat-inducible protein A|nr:paraquat-inducible protein A [Opitutales bacterium]